MNEIQNIDELTAEILIFKQQTAQNIIEIGKRLIAVKKSLPYGEFENYLREKVDFSLATGRRFMRVANEFSNQSSLIGLGSTKIFALLDIPQEKREEFIQINDIEAMSTRELQQAIKEKKELERQLEIEKSKPPVEKQIFPSDYHKLKGNIASYELELKQNEATLKRLEDEKELLKRKVNLNAEEARKYKDMKSQVDFLYKQKNDLSREIESATALSALAVKIDNMLKTELAPVKYSRVFERMDSEVARENLFNILHNVEAWCLEIKEMIPPKYKSREVF